VAEAKGPLRPGPEIYQSIGVEPVINCRGTFTIIGASIELPEVRAAMDAAALHYVQLDELAAAVGQRLAELTGAEWGMVSAGCAAGLKHVTAACVAGGNPEKLLRIPDLRGLNKTEVVIPRSSRTVYDHAIRNIGVTVITVETMEELERALSARTAMIYLTAGGATESGPMSLENVARAARPQGIPILVDAAAEVLTIPNVHLQRGATVVAYSGGKAICGPQCAGLLLGRKDILQSAWQASSPHHGPGRDNKVGRADVSRHHRAERDAGSRGDGGGAGAEGVVEPEPGAADLVGSGAIASDGRGVGRDGGADEAADCAGRRGPGHGGTGPFAGRGGAGGGRADIDHRDRVDDAARGRPRGGGPVVRAAGRESEPEGRGGRSGGAVDRAVGRVG
jgi:hypothetical protein